MATMAIINTGLVLNPKFNAFKPSPPNLLIWL